MEAHYVVDPSAPSFFVFLLARNQIGSAVVQVNNATH